MSDLITLKNPQSPAAEAYRALRTNILFSSVDRPVHTLVVTSPAPSDDADDKSAVVANLAVAMAQAGHPTILVDADLRRPAQHTIWNLPNTAGLSSMMLEENARPPLASVGVENLSVLTSGPLPPNPADLLSAKRMDQAIELLKGQAEYVLFDAPPVLAASDATLLASKLDGLLLVIKAGSTRRDHAQRAREVLERVKIRIIGVALSNAPRDTSISYGSRK
ncbi:MAG TPA: CpsD/CapB family tyrosine-protein kinase [Aggregatilineales bacterium]|nr:CpsD/CapB family tyrosine-protein kinase [Aggregatilineales bacterium]